MRRFVSGLVVVLSLAVLGACSSSSGSSGDSDSTSAADGDTVEGDTADGDSAEADSEQDSEPAACQDQPIEARETPNSPDVTFDLGPYLMQTTKDSAVVMWRTTTVTDGKVVWGLGEALDHETAQDGTSAVHEIKLTGLVADGRYAYKVVSDGVSSAVHHLHAAPADNQAIRFAVVGDSQLGPGVFTGIVEQIRQFQPFVLLHVGDTVQIPIENAAYSAFKEELFDPIRPLAYEVPLYAAIGNHEDQSDVWFSLMSYPSTLMSADQPHYESTYSFRYGNVFVLVIDTNQLSDSTGVLADYITQAVQSEAAQSATWRVAIGHEPGYSDAWTPGECSEYDGMALLRDWFLPLLGQNHFHAYFSGHAHVYERGQANQVLTLITGGGGGTLDGYCKTWDEIQVLRSLHHHLEVEAGCQEMKIRAIDTDGNEIDHVTLDATRYGELIDAGTPYIEGAPTSRRHK